MEYFQNALRFVLILYVNVVIIGVFMKVANRVGEFLGIGRFIILIWEKLSERAYLS